MKIKMRLIVSLLILAFGQALIAQTCLPNGITFLTQSEVDAFPSNYPGCTKIGGNVKIGELDNSSISNVDSLFNLNTIGGNLSIISNYPMTGIDGLYNLKSIGGDLVIGNQGTMTNIDGFSNLNSVGGNIAIQYNDALANVDGLANLNSVGGISIFFNALTNVDGLYGLNSVGGGIEIGLNNALTDLDGLHNLNSVGGHIEIYGNPTLTNINGLYNLYSVGGSLSVYGNDALTDCCGINPLLSASGAIVGDISIYSNPSECSNEAEILAADCKTWLSGTVFYDYNQNKIQDPNESGIPNQKVWFENLDFDRITNTNGGFYQLCDSGAVYQFGWVYDTDWMLTTDTSEYNIQFHPDSINNQYDLGLYPNFSEHAGAINITSNPTRCNTDVNFYVHYQNTGTFIENIDVVIHYDPSSELVSISPNLDYEINTIEHIITWTIDSLYPFNFEDYVLLFAMPDENSTGELLSYNAQMHDQNGELFAESEYSPLVLCSYDPNDKLVMPPGEQEQNYTLHDQKLTYTIRFQNTGNAEAIDITILDTMDNQLDMSTFKIVSSSFPVQTSVKGQAVEYFFPNIWLPDSTSNEPESHGFVTYEIMPIAGLADYSEINNTAYIIFDFNPPIVTNTTKNTMVTTIPVSIHEPNFLDLNIHPNPTSSHVFISGEKPIRNILIYNQLSQLVLQTKDTTIDVSHLPQGIYMVKAEMESGQAIGKLVVE